MLTINGILETALYVTDLNKATQFYQDLFGFEILVRDERLCALNVAGRHVLLLFKQDASLTPVTLPGGTIPYHNGQGPIHIAFAIEEESMVAWQQQLQAKNIVIESIVSFKKGTSLYFRDPDQHLVELTTPAIWALQ